MHGREPGPPQNTAFGTDPDLRSGTAGRSFARPHRARDTISHRFNCNGSYSNGACDASMPATVGRRRCSGNNASCGANEGRVPVSADAGTTRRASCLARGGSARAGACGARSVTSFRRDAAIIITARGRTPSWMGVHRGGVASAAPVWACAREETPL